MKLLEQSPSAFRDSEPRTESSSATPDGKGYSMWLASVYIASFMAGMGILAMPHGLAGMGWPGVVVVCLGCSNSWYTAMLLGRCWLILERRWEQYRGRFRYPYPAIGMRAAGPWMRYVISVALHTSFLGISTVYLLLSAEIAASLTKSVLTMEYKYWIILLAAILCPLSWFGSLEEFWFAAIGALATAALACISLAACLLLKLPLKESPTYGHVDFSSFSLAFGTVFFSFGGSFMCPTIHNDMRNKNTFSRAALVAFVGIFVLYVPVTVLGYGIVGHAVPPNVLAAIEDGPLKMFVDACLAIHVFLAFLLAINPVAQEMEEVFHIKPNFNYKRVIVRTSIVGIVLLVGSAVPHFDKILNLIGGSTMTLLTFIFPPVFYLLLLRSEPDRKNKKEMSLLEKFYLAQVLVTGAAGGISCTYFAVVEIVDVFLKD